MRGRVNSSASTSFSGTGQCFPKVGAGMFTVNAHAPPLRQSASLLTLHLISTPPLNAPTPLIAIHRHRRIATAPMQLFNSPWGSFIRHVWGGPGVDLRRRIFDDELKV